MRNRLYGTSFDRGNERFSTYGQWSFPLAPNSPVFTTLHVMEWKQAITHVYHDLEGDWQFHYPGEKVVEDGVVTLLEEICVLDPTIFELSDLPAGWTATRAGVGQPWVRSPFYASH